MENEKARATDGSGEFGGRGLRSPGYTSTPLPDALDRVKKLKDYAPSRKPIPIDTALKVLGYSPKSGGGLQLVASLKKYNLIDDSGSTDTRAVRVSDMANAILIDQRTDSTERQDLLRKAALSPKLNAEIRERWPHGLPNDATISHWLAGERAFNEKYIPAYLKALRETFEYAKLDDDGVEEDNLGDSPSANEPPPQGDRREGGKASAMAPTPGQIAASITLFGDGDFRIVAPEKISPGNVLLIKSWISALLSQLSPDPPKNDKSHNET